VGRDVRRSAWTDITVTLIPAFEEVATCDRLRAATLLDRCRELNTYLECHADYGDGPDGLVRVSIEEWVGKDEPPLETREQMTQRPQYSDTKQARVTSERRRDGTIRLYCGPEVIAADWISGNRYVKALFHEPTKKEQAFINHFLQAFPSTLH
jgi:hypothetical protein